MSNWTVESLYIFPSQPLEEKSLRKGALPPGRRQGRKTEGERLEERSEEMEKCKKTGGRREGGYNMRFIHEGHIQLFAHCNAVSVALVTTGKN